MLSNCLLRLWLVALVFMFFMTQSTSAGQGLAGMRIAVTVDDLPGQGDLLSGMTRMKITQGVINALKTNGVKQAYGFANGKDIAAEPDLVDVLKAWLKAGYPIGNHTFSHADLDQIGTEAYLAEIQQMQKLLDKLAPVSPLIEHSHVFRYPYLDEGVSLETRNMVRSFLSESGYRIAQVTIDYDDWAWNAAYTRCVRKHDDGSIAWLKKQVLIVAEQHLRNAREMAKKLFNRDIAHILLLHDTMFNAAVLDTMLRDFRQQGVKLIMLDHALADPVYTINPDFILTDGLTFLEQIAASYNINIDNFEDTTYTPDNLNHLCE